MFLALVSLVTIAYLPGAVIYRLPVADRSRRAALPADERVFWAVAISVTITTLLALALAAFGAYSLPRVVGVHGALAVVLTVAARKRLQWAPTPDTPSWSIAMPLALVALGLYLFFPSSEYVMGGKDPGTYMNEGIQIGQRGSLTIHDPTLAAVPEGFRALFLTEDQGEIQKGLNQGVRFMGFFVTDRSRGEVMGQFPHAFPAWIAIGYGLDGLRGARGAVGVWAILGLLAVYFAGARFVGRFPAFIGAVFLAINVAEVWYSRYPNSEVIQQALLFAALLALARAYRDDDRFFAPVAAILLGTLLFVRLDSLVILASVGAGLLLLIADGKRLGWSFLVPLMTLLAVAVAYFTGPMRAYADIAMALAGGVRALFLLLAALFVTGLAVRGTLGRRPGWIQAAQPWVPRVLAAFVVAAAVYAFFLREPVGRLAVHDAYALRAFAWYVGPLGLFAAVAGFTAVAWSRFWKDPVLLTAGALVSAFFFYKIRIVPENFWQARRYLALILPLACMMMAAGAFITYRSLARLAAGKAPLRARAAAGLLSLALPVIVLGWIGWTFAGATRPLLHHVEYAGLVRTVERIAQGFGDRDLVLIEPRYSSDAHVLATPLAYIYARNVLLFSSPRPDRARVGEFLRWAAGTYDRIYLIAEGGLDIASPTTDITPVRNERFSIPEYESARNAYPREIRQKSFSLNVYRLQPVPRAPPAIDIDVGGFDDVWVLRVFGREGQGGVTYRWIRNQSYISLLGISPAARAIVLTASAGDRPASAGTALVQVYLNDHSLGTVSVLGGFAEYRLAIPREVAAEASRMAERSLVRLVCTTWSPRTLHGENDGRALGVMLDRIRVE